MVEQEKKPVWKKWWFWLLLVLALLFVVAVGYFAVSKGLYHSSMDLNSKLMDCHGLYGYCSDECAPLFEKIYNQPC